MLWLLISVPSWPIHLRFKVNNGTSFIVRHIWIQMYWLWAGTNCFISLTLSFFIGKIRKVLGSTSWGGCEGWVRRRCTGKCSVQFSECDNHTIQPCEPQGLWLSSLSDFSKPWVGKKDTGSESRVRPGSKFWPWPYFLCGLRKLLYFFKP